MGEYAQSDWFETNPEAMAYIKNKPNLASGAVNGVEVNGESVVNEDGIAEVSVPVVGVEVDGVSVVDANGIAQITGGGGGGNVDDVEVNGVSVVNAQKVAEIKSYKEITQAAYEALPDTKLADGVMYCITDAHGADGYPPLIYSDEEREVGVWRDGKPLYQKTFSGALTPSSSYITVFSLATYDIDNLVSGEGFVKSSTQGYGGQIGASLDSNWPHLGWYITNGGEDFQIYYPANDALDIFAVTVQYTKTTDTAGSGTWTTQGGYAHHYSTSEHVIGTWIDGKPIYEKTWDLGQDITVGSWTTVMSVAGVNINKIVNSISVQNDPAVSFIEYWVDGTTLKGNSLRQSGSDYVRYLTLQYTKTTD